MYELYKNVCFATGVELLGSDLYQRPVPKNFISQCVKMHYYDILILQHSVRDPKSDCKHCNLSVKRQCKSLGVGCIVLWILFSNGIIHFTKCNGSTNGYFVTNEFLFPRRVFSLSKELFSNSPPKNPLKFITVQSTFRGLVTRQQVAFYIQVHFYVYRFTLRTGSF